MANPFKNFFLRVPLFEKMLFAKHLSIMIRAGMPILNSLQVLKKQAKSKSFKKILEEVGVDIDNGQFLSASLEKHVSVFGKFFINIIRVGEASGTLADNLNYLHEELKKNYELRRKIKAALTYPIIILVAATAIGGLLIFFVFPKIISIFSGFQAQLHLSTRILIAFVNFMTNYFLWLIIAFVVLAVLIWFLFKISRVKFLYHRFILMMPFVGGVACNINMTNFARTLGSLLKSGIKIVDAILITADTIPNLVYGKKLREIAERVRGGESMSHYMIQEEKFFPAIFSQMVEVGETTGHLDENLAYLANFYEAEADDVFKNLSTSLEPTLLLVMGLIVGFIAISVITPIYKIAGGLGL